jgi:hypothetical protein
MYELKELERYLPVNLLGPGPRLTKKEFTGPRSHKGSGNCYKWGASAEMFNEFNMKISLKLSKQWFHTDNKFLMVFVNILYPSVLGKALYSYLISTT